MNIKVGFLGVLALIFIYLKLLNIIAWSWVWVLTPLWIIPAFVILVATFAILLATISALAGYIKRRA